MTQKEEIVGISEHIKELRKKIGDLAKQDMTVLILGPTGTGKELVAKNIHYRSKRKEKPFEILNCAAIPSELLESELFGHEKGAFTGAIGKTIGKFELASHGTIMLDEIGDLKPPHQAALLRVLEEKKIYPVGGKGDKKIDVRIIASTNKDLLSEVQRGHFREDLYHRLSQAVIHLNPLGGRPEDVIALTNYFIHQNEPKIKTDPRGKFLLYAYEVWPGNVRELKNMILHADDFSYIRDNLEEKWRSVPKKNSQEENLDGDDADREKYQDRFMEAISFVKRTDVDFKKYVEMYEIISLNSYVKKNEICKVLHLRRDKVFQFKKEYGFELDLNNDMYIVYHPLDVYPNPKTIKNTYPDLFNRLLSKS
jgi:transcriptional regulator with GAF, ATPase, and Fis domain